MVHRIWGALGAAFALAACGVDAEERLRRSTVTYEALDGGFSVRYVDPPWEQVAADADSLELQIPPQVFGVMLEGTDPTHVFQIAYVDAHARIAELAEPQEVIGELDTDWPETGGLDTAEDWTEGAAGAADIPDYLLMTDLSEPGAVALAELDHLLVAREANLDTPLQPFLTNSVREGLVYQVIIKPGLFVRVFCFPAPRAVVRAAFISAFDLRTTDVDDMVREIHTGHGDPL